MKKDFLFFTNELCYSRHKDKKFYRLFFNQKREISK